MFIRPVSLALLLAVTPVLAQRGGNIRPIQNYAESCSDAVAGAACNTPKLWCVTSNNTTLRCDPTTRLWATIGSSGSGFAAIEAGEIAIGTGASDLGESQCTATGNQIDCPVEATVGTTFCFKEPSDFGTNEVCFEAPDGGFTGDSLCTLTADGAIPADCLERAQPGNVVGSGYGWTWGAGLTGTCSDLSTNDCTVETSSEDVGFISGASISCGASTQGKMVVTAGGLKWCDATATPVAREAVIKDGPTVTGKITVDLLTTPVDDDLCTNEQGKFWFDSTDNRFEFCEVNTATAPTALGGGSGDITDVFNCSSGDCASIAMADGDFLDASSVNNSGTSEGLKLPQATDVSAATAEGQVGWDTDQDILYVGNVTAAQPIGQGRWGTFPLIDNRWYGCNLGENLGVSTTDAAAGVGTTVDRAYACPIYLQRPYNFDSAGFVTAVAGTNLYVAVYAMAATGLPGALEHGVATIDVSGGAGSKTAAINWTIQSGWHWLVWKSDNSSMQGNNKWTMSSTAYTSSPFGASSLPVTAESTFYGACTTAACSATLPSNWSETDGNTYVDSDLPQVMLQVNNP